MQQLQASTAKWRQLDAGLWVKEAQSGRVEINFATDVDGSAVYELIAYDDRGRRSERHSPSKIYNDLHEARDIGDRILSRNLEASNDGLRWN